MPQCPGVTRLQYVCTPYNKEIYLFATTLGKLKDMTPQPRNESGIRHGRSRILHAVSTATFIW